VNPADDDVRPDRPTWAAFTAWAVLGVVAGFSAVSFPTGLIVPIILGVAVSRVRPASRRSWTGALTGAGGVCLFVAFVQRRGPGTVCWHTATASGCDDYLDPLPWLVVGVALVAAGLVLHVRHRRTVPA
jgi:hypothetical protein